MFIAKTELGQRVMKDRSVPLTPRQRAAFILFDGRRTIEQVLAATAAVGVTREDVDHMVSVGLLEGTAGSGAAAMQPVATPPAQPLAVQQAAAEPSPIVTQPERSPQQRYAAAYPIATALTAGLGLRGFRLNLAVEAAGSFEDLLQVAPKIRDAVGPDKFKPLELALHG
jgi:hypothetical protein